MIYVVSGYMRTGTSMMMAALEAGGMEPLFNPDRDRMNRRWGDQYYQPNAGGFYELKREQFLELGFPRMHDGKLVKVLFQGLTRLVVHDYLVVFMLRDPEEIRQSYDAFFGSVPPPVQYTIDNYEALMREAVALLENRKDTQVWTLYYPDVVANPEAAFETLRGAGWPVDVEAAATVIDPGLYRFRREFLTEGI